MQQLKDLIETHKLQIGDHFKWMYNALPSGQEPYWCKSQMCVWDGVHFKDLFWSMGESTTSFILPVDNILLCFIGNIYDYNECREYEMKYYDESDILNRGHSNHNSAWGSCFFIKKGAVRSRDKIKTNLLHKLEEAEYKIKSAMYDKTKIQEYLDNIDDPNYNLNDIYI